eukprot:CAMPEP_0170551154 /NCGR_PEP_ID=MMETSP0211-20121228/9187_1 /TAXON_ID=311385 /ORGANISM="Pseudokeronopsis sp., Strain OXSARD2" /LENGTH=131 /DNA_ID=CAMNT_0010858151 /DNA_START=919 /DNA_END=1314 /DNA_ORIENTATION=+
MPLQKFQRLESYDHIFEENSSYFMKSYNSTASDQENEDEHNEDSKYRNKGGNQSSKSSLGAKQSSQQVSNQNMGSNQFNFPDGGWVCSQCQNYNFCGRVKCNRCNKVKTKQDFNGKPKHLLKKNSLSSTQE